VHVLRTVATSKSAARDVGGWDFYCIPGSAHAENESYARATLTENAGWWAIYTAWHAAQVESGRGGVPCAAQRQQSAHACASRVRRVSFVKMLRVMCVVNDTASTRLA
jgi:hypothetical protein